MGTRNSLRLDGDAGIRRAREIADKVRDALSAEDSISVITEDVGTADITTIQILIAARRQAGARGKEFALARPIGKPLADALKLNGFLSEPFSSTDPDAAFWAGENVGFQNIEAEAQ